MLIASTISHPDHPSLYVAAVKRLSNEVKWRPAVREVLDNR